MKITREEINEDWKGVFYFMDIRDEYPLAGIDMRSLFLWPTFFSLFLFLYPIFHRQFENKLRYD